LPPFLLLILLPFLLPFCRLFWVYFLARFFEYAVQKTRYFEYAVQKSVARFWVVGVMVGGV